MRSILEVVPGNRGRVAANSKQNCELVQVKSWHVVKTVEVTVGAYGTCTVARIRRVPRGEVESCRRGLRFWLGEWNLLAFLDGLALVGYWFNWFSLVYKRNISQGFLLWSSD